MIPIISLMLIAVSMTTALNMVRWPMLIGNTGTEFTVGWQTDIAVSARLEWGTAPNALNNSLDSTNLREWRTMKIAGLDALQKYYYRAVAWKGGDTVRSDVFPLYLQIVQGPQVGNNRKSEFTVGWQTDSLCGSRLEWGTTYNNLSNSAVNDSLRRWHVLKATGLMSDTKYFYRVVSWKGDDTVKSPVWQTRSAVSKDTPFTFSLLTDSHGGMAFAERYNGNEGTRYLQSHLLLQDSADFFIQTGDVVGTNDNPVEDSCFAMILRYKKNTDVLERSTPMYECFGNHDGGTNRIWANTDTSDYGFILPEDNILVPAGSNKGHFYSFDYGLAHFTIADIKEASNVTGFLEWLQADLSAARARGQEHLFVLSHYPLLDFGRAPSFHTDYWWSGSYYKGRASNVYHILDSMGVEGWFFGHWHNYTRYRINPQIYSGFDSLWNRENFRNQVLFLSCGHFGGSGYSVDTAQYNEDFYTRNYAAMVVKCDVNFRQVTIRGISQSVNWTGTSWSRTTIDSFQTRPAIPQNLTVERNGSTALLSWDAVSAGKSLYGVGGYHIYRSNIAYGNLRNTSQSAYTRIGTVNGSDSSKFTDISPTTDAYYTVTAFDTNASRREGNYSEEVSLNGTSNTVGMFKLAEKFTIRALPNPFNSGTTLSFNVPHIGSASLKVYNLRGNLVSTITSGEIGAGQQTVYWNGCGERGKALPSGIYWIKLSTQSSSETIRIHLIR